MDLFHLFQRVLFLLEKIMFSAEISWQFFHYTFSVKVEMRDYYKLIINHYINK